MFRDDDPMYKQMLAAIAQAKEYAIAEPGYHVVPRDAPPENAMIPQPTSIPKGSIAVLAPMRYAYEGILQRDDKGHFTVSLKRK